MEESKLEESVRTRLIIAGLEELHEHGVSDFSLRRVALAAQVSCAAPYRHFKDKGELIGAIIEYIASKWRLLCNEIEHAFEDDPRRLTLELCTSSIRFWIANGSFRTVLMTNDPAFAQSLNEFDAPTDRAARAYLEALERAEEADELINTIHTLIYGTVLLITQGRVPPTNAAVMSVRHKIEAILK